MSTQHTPTPWKAGENSFAIPFRFVTGTNGRVIAYCDQDKETAKQNALFIARACNAHADMLAALIECEVLLDKYPFIKRMVKEAITKATRQ